MNSTVEFFVGRGKNKKKVSFNVEHNLGSQLEAAVINWSFRTDTYTAESLSEYINSKNSGHHCKPAP